MGVYLAWGGSNRFLDPLIPEFGSTRLRNIRQEDLDAIARQLLPNGLPQTCNRQCYTPFIAVWNYASKAGWVDAKQWLRQRKPEGTNAVRLKSERGGQRPVDYERAVKFVASMSLAPAMPMTALFYTGLRPINRFRAYRCRRRPGRAAGLWCASSKPASLEACRCTRSCVSGWRLWSSAVSFYSERHAARCTLRCRMVGGGLTSAINGARHRSGIKDVSPYTGRHTVSTGLVIAGVHAHVKDQILGHVSTE